MSKLDIPERRKEMSDIEKVVRPLSFAVIEEIKRMREYPESKIDPELEKVRDSIEQKFSWTEIREELKRQISDEINARPEYERKSLRELFDRVEEWLFGKVLKIEESPAPLPELMAHEMVNAIILGDVEVNTFSDDLNNVATKMGIIGNIRLLGQFKNSLAMLVKEEVEKKNNLSKMQKEKYLKRLKKIIEEWMPNS